jgi:hypothetical protein
LRTAQRLRKWSRSRSSLRLRRCHTVAKESNLEHPVVRRDVSGARHVTWLEATRLRDCP